jgi:hypothetical protein
VVKQHLLRLQHHSARSIPLCNIFSSGMHSYYFLGVNTELGRETFNSVVHDVGLYRVYISKDVSFIRYVLDISKQ